MIGGHTRGVAHYQGRALQRPQRTTRAGDWRGPLVRTLRILALTVVITGATVAAPVVGEVVVNSPLLAVRQIEVTGAERLTQAQVVRMAGLTVGMPVIAVSPHAVERALLRSPRIQAATVERGWGGAVRVAVVERRGMALVANALADSAATPLVVAQDGVLLDPLGSEECTDLPFLTGLDAPHLRAGDRIPLARFRPIASLLEMMRRPDVALTPEISSIDLAAGDTLWLTTLRNGSRVLLPQRPITVDDLVTLHGVLSDCDKQNLPAQRIDMTFKDMVVLDPADPRALQHTAREHRLEEQRLAVEARARQAAADSLARVAALAVRDSLLLSAAPAARGHHPRRPALSATPDRGPLHDHSSTSRRRTAAGDGRHSTTSHRSLPRW